MTKKNKICLICKKDKLKIRNIFIVMSENNSGLCSEISNITPSEYDEKGSTCCNCIVHVYFKISLSVMFYG